MRRVKTPRDAKGSSALKILRKTTASVLRSRIPPRNASNMRHVHSLVSARQIVRIDRHPWEERVAAILQVLEAHRYGRANALHNAISAAEQARQDAMKKTLEAETFSEEVQAANEEMRANAEEMRAANEEMRAANEEMRLVSEELDRMHSDVEQLTSVFSIVFAPGLSRIRENAEEVMTHFGETLDDTAKGKLKYAADQASHLDTMVNQLLTYWDVELQGKTLETTELEKIFETVLSHLRDAIKTAKAVITHDTLPMAVVDASQFTLLFECLIKNSLLLCKGKTPEIHVRLENIVSTGIELPEPKMEQGWIISITDNGSMIPEDAYPRLFQVFSEIPGGPGQGQAGMELATAWRIVKRHGGHIWLASSTQEGNTWCFTVPGYDSHDAAASGV